MVEKNDTKILAELGLAGVYTGIENRMVKIAVTLPDLTPVSVDGHFFYLKFRGKNPTIEEFVEFLYYKIVAFCIPRLKRDAHYKKFLETHDDRYPLELQDQAKNLFIKAAKTLRRSGEPGELILFTILEAFLDAPQVACKMYLKTSENMPVHGSDGIHMKYDRNTGDLILMWGESKLYGHISQALDQICESVAKFNCVEKGRSPRERDIDIIRDHVNIADPDTRTAFLAYFDPYSAESNKRREVFCCLSGFDFNFYKELTSLRVDEVENRFKEKYELIILNACKSFRDKIVKNDLMHLDFIFILLPFKSVAEFRKLFFGKLGVDLDSFTDEGGEI